MALDRFAIVGCACLAQNSITAAESRVSQDSLPSRSSKPFSGVPLRDGFILVILVVNKECNVSLKDSGTPYLVADSWLRPAGPDTTF